jgi:uncharacterized protein (DUF488 family)
MAEHFPVTGIHTLATIGYQSATMRSFLETLVSANVKLLVDVRAVAMSRRPGFAKTALSANLHEAGIDYLHFRKLGTPPDGRAAARAGNHDEMHRIFREQLATPAAQDELRLLSELVQGARPVAIMCFEAEARYCHRRIVANAVADLMPVQIVDLMPDVSE